MNDTTTSRLASRFSEHSLPARGESSSPLAKLDLLIEEVGRCSNRGCLLLVGELESLRQRIFYLLYELGPNCMKLRDSVERMRFPEPAASAKPRSPMPQTAAEWESRVRLAEPLEPKLGKRLLPKREALFYSSIKKLQKVLRQARKIYMGVEPKIVAPRQQHQITLDRLVRDVMGDNPNHQQREICGEVDDRCATKNIPVPLLPSWKRKAPGVENLVAAFDHPKLHDNVKTYLSKKKNPSTR